MRFIKKLTAATRKQVDNLHILHEKREKAAEDKARRQLALARTQMEKERVKLQLYREKAALQKELLDARTELARAKRENWEHGAGGKAERFVRSSLKSGAAELQKAMRNMSDTKPRTRIASRKKSTKARGR